MKAILIFLLLAIITLSEAAGPHLRSLRSIPNRAPRKSMAATDTVKEEPQISTEPDVEN